MKEHTTWDSALEYSHTKEKSNNLRGSSSSKIGYCHVVSQIQEIKMPFNKAGPHITSQGPISYHLGKNLQYTNMI